MGVLDKFLNAIKVNDDDFDDYDDDFYDEEDEEVSESRSSRREERSSSKVTPMRPSSRTRGTSAGMEVVVVKPTTVDDAREITDTLLANKIVNLNLEGLDVAIAQRIIDFTSGSTYAMGGNLQKISHYIFLVTPRSVDISGDVPEFGDSSGMGSPVSKII